jgi:hypothetical protein
MSTMPDQNVGDDSVALCVRETMLQTLSSHGAVQCVCVDVVTGVWLVSSC